MISMPHRATFPMQPNVATSLAAAAALLCGTAAAAQQPATMPGMTMPGMTVPGMTMRATPTPSAPPTQSPAATPADDTLSAMSGMPAMPMTMRAMLGPYPMTRESSGTSWQPDSARMTMAMLGGGGAWSLMAQGYVTGIYDDQGGRRGDAEAFSTSMGMLMANRALGDHATLGLRAMLSLDPLMGPRGYPLLFATGETADGRTQLVDRQHPHDLVMELATSLSYDLGGGRAVSLYAGLPGEPALGPPAFMHRESGMVNPEAPIGHHWFDSTHITFGVLTAGLSGTHWKIEASAFKGREPDQHRYDIESPRLDSWAVRGFLNPTANLSLQLSTGHLHSPEQLDPDRDEQRTTASATWHLPLGHGASLASTIGWSRKDLRPGPALTGWLGESALRLGPRHTIFARAEHEREDELFAAGAPQEGRIFGVSKLSLGYQYEVPVARHLGLAFGGLVSGYAYPDALKPAYGADGIKSFMLYTRLSFGG